MLLRVYFVELVTGLRLKGICISCFMCTQMQINTGFFPRALHIYMYVRTAGRLPVPEMHLCAKTQQVSTARKQGWWRPRSSLNSIFGSQIEGSLNLTFSMQERSCITEKHVEMQRRETITEARACLDPKKEALRTFTRLSLSREMPSGIGVG